MINKQKIASNLTKKLEDCWFGASWKLVGLNVRCVLGDAVGAQVPMAIRAVASFLLSSQTNVFESSWSGLPLPLFPFMSSILESSESAKLQLQLNGLFPNELMIHILINI